jgi:S-DNA-T family DNA segregation ATPase FtsK/SpoIIIE
MLIGEIDQNYTEVNTQKERRYLNDEDINYVRTHYSNYAKYTLKSSRSKKIITQTDTGLELSFLMHENNEKDSIIYPLSKEAHVIVGGDDSKELNKVNQTIINSINQHYKSNEVQLVIASNNQEKLNNYQAYMYNNQEVITDTEALIQTLSELEKVMLDRFKLFQEHIARDLKIFNHQQINISDRLPYIVIVIDNIQIDDNEHKEKFEDLIMRLTQRSRAAGIHLVMLTSDPNRDVSKLYGYFIPNRVAFRLSQPYQSKALLGNDKACYLKHQEYICETYQSSNKNIKKI